MASKHRNEEKQTASNRQTVRQIERLQQALVEAEAVVVGAGAGLSTAAGYLYDGERFQKHFADFIERYRFRNMYEGGFYPFPTLEEKWAYWSRYIWINRYEKRQSALYQRLLDLLRGKEFFVITTNVDHLFQDNDFLKERLFYAQGDYGLWQCSVPCHEETYDNRETVRRMFDEQTAMRVPTELVPHCPRCGEPMEMNLRADSSFVEDAGWHAAAKRYQQFLRAHQTGRVLYWEFGVGANTPGIIKYPFWALTKENPEALYCAMNLGEAVAPQEIAAQSILIDGDIDVSLKELQTMMERGSER